MGKIFSHIVNLFFMTMLNPIPEKEKKKTHKNNFVLFIDANKFGEKFERSINASGGDARCRKIPQIPL